MMMTQKLFSVTETDSEQKQYTLTLDDDPLVPKLIEKALSLPTVTFSSESELRPQLPNLNPSAVFIDVHLREGSGLNLIPELAHQWPFIPLIVITADSNESFILEALARGADDFIRKPIKPSELKARLQKRWKDQAKKQSLSVLNHKDIVLDAANALLKGPKSTRSLSPTEVRLLVHLLQAEGTPISRSALKFSCWHQIAVSENSLDRKIYEVRKALLDVGSLLEIETIYGEGFVLK
ncbi:MAG: DNA-binding response regulator [Proteobacteria bacterium]|nr:DNA-binding response regulator [Pseudomonadota bacterium]NBY20393.1 DNA-binding response regulator [bacterium]